MPELVVEDLTVRSGGTGRPILAGVSLAVKPGEFVALVGGSGSGKTMTARSVLQLLPPQLSIESGSIRLGALDVTGASEAELNRVRGGRLGMLFQQPKKMFNPNKTIGTHLREPLKLHSPAWPSCKDEGSPIAGRGGLRGSATGCALIPAPAIRRHGAAGHDCHGLGRSARDSAGR